MENEGLHMCNFKLKRSKTIHHSLIYIQFPNHDVTKTGLSLPKGHTRLGNNF